MGYDFFTQPKGPDIDISLFGDAAIQGAAVGKATPTTLTSILTGAVEGVKTGLDIQGQYQQNQLRAQQIEASKMKAESDALQLERERQNQQLQLEADTAKLKNDVSKQQDELKTRQEENDFQNEFSALQGNTKAQADLVLSGKYGGVLSKNQALYKQSLQQVYPAMTPEQKLGVDKFFAKSDVDQVYNHQAALRQAKFADAKQAMLDDSLTAELTASGKLDVPPDNYPDQGMFKLSGAYVKDPATGAVEIDPNTMQWKTTPGFDPTTAHNTYDYIAKDGTILAQNVTADSKKKYEALKQERGYQDGSFASKALTTANTAIDAKHGVNQPAAQQQSAPQAPQSFTRPAMAGVDPFVATLKSSLNISDEQVVKIGSPIKSLERVIATYIQDPTVRADPRAISDISDKVHTILRSVTDDEFDSSIALQSQNTPEQVDAYNRGLWDQLVRPSASAAFGGAADAERRFAIYKAAKLETPQDLYYAKRSGALGDKLNGFIGKIAESISSRDSTVFKGQVATQKNLNYLNSVANGP
jgi:hypothetical protein